MVSVFNAIAFATALTALFAFRFRVHRPRTLGIYFAFFATLEATVAHHFLPEGAVPPVTAVVLFGIAALFGVGVFVLRRLERDAARDTEQPEG
jgi:predicted membrane-bound mannosyltransferase